MKQPGINAEQASVSARSCVFRASGLAISQSVSQSAGVPLTQTDRQIDVDPRAGPRRTPLAFTYAVRRDA